MNIRIYILALILLSALHTEAQLRYGFRFGGDFASSQLKDAPGFSLDNKSGFTGGLMLEYQFEKNGFSPEIAILYGRHNTRLIKNETDFINVGRNYIDIPLRLKYKFWLKSTHDLFAPMIYTGPTISFRLDQKNAELLNIKNMQSGWDIGLGVDAINFIQLTAGYRFGLGNSLNQFKSCPDARLRANGWNLSVNLLFDF